MLLSVNNIQRATKCRLCEKMGNLTFALSANTLRISTFAGCVNSRLFGFSLLGCLSEAIVSCNNLQLCLTEVVMPRQLAGLRRLLRILLYLLAVVFPNQ